ncbi:MAG: carboxypeptidase regulatory-like domain-containing protein [Flavobacteriaceae bacterium]|nr:carboxypeptidase regulatory-like domain-containing protein [Flavobacteriaceae bacterium]
MKTLFYLLVFAFTISVSGQIRISGVVNDETGKPMDMANVIALNKSDNSLQDYAITSPSGEYSLKLKKDTKYEISVSYLGYKTLKIAVNTTGQIGDISKVLNLTELDNTLETVEIDIPVTIRGDTIIYNADSFTNGTERKLEDVLKKLPGMEINDEGQIEIEGKTVGKIMIDGKDFFDGDTKIAMKNIPADAISKIQVLKNYNEVSQMKGLGDDSESMAINIKLKNGKKNFWFGDITATLGLDDRYLFHPNIFYQGNKSSLNIINDMNNIGDVPFSYRDYRNFTGNMNTPSTGVNLSEPIGASGLSALRDDKAKEIENKFSAINYTYRPNKKLTISTFGVFSQTDTELLTHSMNNNLGNGSIENTINNTSQSTDLYMMKAGLEYKPNSNLQIDYNIFFKESDSDETKNIDSEFTIGGDSGSDNITINTNEKPVSIDQIANIYYTLDEKNIFSAFFKNSNSENNPFYNSITGDQRFSMINTDNSQDVYNMFQNKELANNKFDASIDYYYVINDRSNVNLTIGSSMSKQTLMSSISQKLDNGTYLDFSEQELNNDVKYDFTDNYLGLHYKFKTGMFTFTPGAILHNYKSENTQYGIVESTNKSMLLPDFRVKVDIKKSESINITYKITNSFTSVNNLAEGNVLRSYSSIFNGNSSLEKAVFETYSLRYFNFKMYNFSSIYGRISYTKKKDNFKSDSDITGINGVSTIVNLPNPEESFNSSLSYSRTFFSLLKFRVRGSYNWSNTNSIQNGKILNSTSQTQGYQAKLSTNFSEWPNVGIGYNLSLRDYEGARGSDKYTTHRPFANIEASFLKNFTFTADYKYYDYSNQDGSIKNTYSFLDSSIYFNKEGSKWEFRAYAKNLLNTKTINDDNISDLYVSSSQFYVQPRYFLMSVKYIL